MTNVAFEKISPTPTLPASLSSVNFANYFWESQAKDVKAFKAFLKDELREAQVGTCCFCRRVIHDDCDLEHFLEKAEYKSHEFKITNLALSCTRCNTKKQGRFKRIMNRLEKSAGKKLTPASPWIVGFYDMTKPDHSQAYRIIHPHFHDYSINLVIHKNWVYKHNTKIGLRTKKTFDLNGIAELEFRYLKEAILRRKSTTSKLLASASIWSEGEFEFKSILKLVTNILKSESEGV